MNICCTGGLNRRPRADIYFYRAFCGDRAQVGARQRREKGDSGNAYTAASKVLNFVAALLAAFELSAPSQICNMTTGAFTRPAGHSLGNDDRKSRSGRDSPRAGRQAKLLPKT